MTKWFTDPDANVVFEQNDDLRSRIRKVKESLDISMSNVNFEDVRSIPDTWNIHRIYEMMIVDDVQGAAKSVDKQFQTAVVRHWRALIAVMYLADRFGLTIKSETIGKEDFANVTGGLPKSAWDSRPRRSMLNNKEFASCPYDPDRLIIYYVEKDGKKLPFAMSSATTFLVPTADAWKNLYTACNSIPWIKKKLDDDGNILYCAYDPTRIAGALPLVDRQSLMMKIKTQMHYYSTLDESKRQANRRLNEQLDKFEDSLEAPPQTADVFPENGFIYYVTLPNANDLGADDPQVGGIDPRCICKCTVNGGKSQERYLVAMPLTKQAKEWLVHKEAEYSISVTEGPVFKTQFVYRGTAYTCEYRGSTAKEISRGNLGITTLWPRYQMDGWKKYYVFRSESLSYLDSQYTIVPEGTPTIDETGRRKEKAYDLSKAQDNGKYKPEPIRLTYTEYAKRPISWTLEKNGKQLGYFITREGTLRTEETDPESVYFSAIDFGTSATMVYGRVGNHEAKPLSGDDIWSLPIYVDGSDKENYKAAYKYFVPPTNTDMDLMPMQSLLGIDKKLSPLFLGNWAYFRQKAAALGHSELPPDFFCLKSDLKWDPMGSATYADSYLRILANFVMLEARVNGCGKVRTTITYPSAMRGYMTYVQRMRSILDDIAKETGVTIDERNRAEDKDMITESEAAARTLSQNTSDGVSFCSIDIGGGTSDIFLFNGEDKGAGLVYAGYESSILCGARNILLDGFMNRGENKGSKGENVLLNALLENTYPEFKTALGECINLNGFILETDPPKIYSNIELLFGLNLKVGESPENAGERLRLVAMSADAIDRSKGEDRKVVFKLRKRVAFRIAAILYYAGMMTRGVCDDLSGLYLSFAGNGSKTLNWLCENPNLQRQFISAMFNAGAGKSINAAGSHNPERIMFARDPKHEVAKGAMLSYKTLNLSTHVNEVLAGECFAESGAPEKSAETAMLNIMPVPGMASFEFDKDKTYRVQHKEAKYFVMAFREYAKNILKIEFEKDEFNPEEVSTNQKLIGNFNHMDSEMTKGNSADIKSFFIIEADELCKHYLKLVEE